MDDDQQNEQNTLLAWILGIAVAIAIAVSLIIGVVAGIGGEVMVTPRDYSWLAGR